eukprot:TRINITY_DN17413_c0_g1_i3.p1 TRINITY_DN17413_c0_g1~~TRINITY_DN17413_c0_g1_i3.p1  ORF type:complete len:557 (-),score=122.97 TRINITY_DN17413_c0_g1_i3:5-1675(-)
MFFARRCSRSAGSWHKRRFTDQADKAPVLDQATLARRLRELAASQSSEQRTRQAGRSSGTERQPNDELEGVVEGCVRRSDEFTPKSLATVASALAKLRKKGELEAIAAAAASRMGREPAEFNEQDVAILANALARARCRNTIAFFMALQALLERQEALAKFFTAQGLANTLNAFAALGVELSPPTATTPSALSAKMSAACSELAADFSHAQLANVLNSIARLRMTEALSADGRPLSAQSRLKLRPSWEAAILAQLPNFEAQAVANTLNAMARLSVDAPHVLAQVTKHITESLPPERFVEQDVALILNASARLGVSDEALVTFMQSDVLPRVLPTFTSQGLANATLALSRLPRTSGSRDLQFAETLAEECRARCLKHSEAAHLASRTSRMVLQEPHHVINLAFAFAIFSFREQGGSRWLEDVTRRLLTVLLSLIGNDSTADHGNSPLAPGNASFSPEAAVQLYTVLLNVVALWKHRLHVLPLSQVSVYERALELCDPEAMLRAFKAGVTAGSMVETSMLHQEVSRELRAQLDGRALLVVDEAFVPPYMVDICVRNAG